MLYYLFLIALLIFISVFTLIAGITGAPTVPSPKEVTDKMVSLMKVRQGHIYYDLGAGDGRIIKGISKRKGFGIGFECTPPTYLLAKIKTRKNKRIRVFFKNFYQTHLGKAKGIFCFLSPQAMKRLEKKFEKELRFGTTVISYAFSMPNKKAEQIIKYKNYAPIYVYKY